MDGNRWEMSVNNPSNMINLQGYIARIIINKHYSK